MNDEFFLENLPKLRKKSRKKVSKSFEVSNISLSETELANDCQKVRPKFGRTEFSVYHYIVV